MQENLTHLKRQLRKVQGVEVIMDIVHWAHVGDVKHVNELLAEAVRFWQILPTAKARTRKVMASQPKAA